MADIAITLKRTAAVTAWSLWINSITGQAPNISQKPNGVDITWKPGQAKKMERYFSDAMKPSTPDPHALNVNVDLKPVLLPLVAKKTIGYIAGYTVLIIIGTKLIWK